MFDRFDGLGELSFFLGRSEFVNYYRER